MLKFTNTHVRRGQPFVSFTCHLYISLDVLKFRVSNLKRREYKGSILRNSRDLLVY